MHRHGLIPEGWSIFLKGPVKVKEGMPKTQRLVGVEPT